MGKLLTTLLSLLLFILLILFCSIPNPSEALKLNLIPPSSPKSPVYLGNLTLSEKIKILANHSQARVQLLSGHWAFPNTTNSNHTSHKDQYERPRPIVHGFNGNGPLYAVDIILGTFGEDGSSMLYSLLMDTTSPLTWLQCEGCLEHQQCFRQLDPLYPSTKSRSYKPLLWSRDTDLCDPSNLQDDICYYNVTYWDNSTSFGQLGYETMIFRSDTGGLSIEGGLVLGCGLSQVGVSFGKNGQPSAIAGVLGLGQGSYALQKQLAPRGSHGMFSYCLPDILNSVDGFTFLHFGDIFPNSSYTETPLTPVAGRQFYSLNVLGIIVNGDPMIILPSIFQINNSDGSGGTILDSGTTFSYLHPSAYYTLESYLASSFSTNSNYERIPSGVFRLCYKMKEPEGYSKLPTIVFVVEGGFLEISPEQAFYVGEVDLPDKKLQNFCLMMLPNYASMTVIGAYQQVNHRFIYDTEQLKLWFTPADCASEP